MTQEEKDIIEEFSWFDDPMDRYEYIIEIGKNLEPLAEEYKTEENIVKGCQSKVWLKSFLNDDKKVEFRADSNTVITKGIVALLVRVLNKKTPQQIIDHPLTFIEKINLRSHLSSQRSNGLSAMVKQMKMDALAYQTLSSE